MTSTPSLEPGGRARPVVAVFDFDGTITDRHTFWRFLRVLGGPVKFWFTVVTMLPWILGIYYRGTDVMSAREVLIRRLLKGLPQRRFEQAADDFALRDIPAWVRPEALAAIRRHRAQGDRLFLVSNSAQAYLAPWGRGVGMDAVCGSRFAVDAAGRLTGELDGEHCQGEEKLRRLHAELGDLAAYELHVYGDSDGDVAMLRVADYAYYLTFDPAHRNDQRLAAPPAAAHA